MGSDFDIGGLFNMVMNPMSMLGGMMGGGGSQQSGGANGAGGANGSQGTDMMSSMTNPMQMISSIINMCTGGGQGGGSGGGASTTENTSDVQDVPGDGYAATYDQQRASALKNVQKYFDQLDTIAGGSKDGLITRADLMLAQANLSLPKELRDACAFINNNPAEFNQLDVAAGIGSCDGLIGKGDVDAVIAGLPKTDGSSGGTSPAPTGSDPTGSTYGSDGVDGGEGAGTVDPEPWHDNGTDYTPAPGARESDLRDEAIQKFGSKLDDLQGKIDNLLNKDGDLTPSEQTKLQGYMQKRTELHPLLSNLMEMEHEIKKSIIQNIR